jgi:hypothetical protein
VTVMVEESTIGNDVDPALLLAIALAYHTAQYRLQVASERAARDLFLRLKPINDTDLTEWMAAWDRVLAAQQAQQGLLTTTYVRTTLARFGVTLPREVTVPSSSPLWDDLASFASSDTFRRAPAAMQRNVEAALGRASVGAATARDAHLADRALNLGAPVVKVRAATAAGATLDEAVDVVLPHVEGVTYNANRAAERIAVNAISTWPTFQNGQAMLYRRIPQAGACGWCVTVATRLYGLASGKRTAIWHRGCRCAWQLVSEEQASRYAKALKGSDSDYFAAARAAGMWTGDAPANYRDFIRTNRFDPAAAAAGATGVNEGTAP